MKFPPPVAFSNGCMKQIKLHSDSKRKRNVDMRESLDLLEIKLCVKQASF